MKGTKEICLDASIVIKLVVYEELGDKVRAFIADAQNQGYHFIGPVFFEAEVDSSLRKKAMQREITIEESDKAFKAAMRVPITLIREEGQRERAWELSKQFGFWQVYDAIYLALAELRSCELWTADQRLYNATKDKLPFVKWIGDYKESSKESTE